VDIHNKAQTVCVEETDLQQQEMNQVRTGLQLINADLHKTQDDSHGTTIHINLPL
jgi:hypothetical protein